MHLPPGAGQEPGSRRRTGLGARVVGVARMCEQDLAHGQLWLGSAQVDARRSWLGDVVRYDRVAIYEPDQ